MTIPEIKNKVMSISVNSNELVALVDENFHGSGDEIIYENIFPYFREPNAEDEQKTYVCIAVDTDSTYGARNKNKKNIIRFLVITHQDLMKCKGGTRIDLISELIEDMFTKRTDFGLGFLELDLSKEGDINRHHYRIMQFVTADTNKLAGGE